MFSRFDHLLMLEHGLVQDRNPVTIPTCLEVEILLWCVRRLATKRNKLFKGVGSMHSHCDDELASRLKIAKYRAVEAT